MPRKSKAEQVAERIRDHVLCADRVSTLDVAWRIGCDPSLVYSVLIKDGWVRQTEFPYLERP